MKKEKKEELNTDAYTEYRNKIYLPGFFKGDKLPPALSLPRMVGYMFIMVGFIGLCIYFVRLIGNFFSENFVLIITNILTNVVFIYLGFRLVRHYSKKKF